MKISLVRKLYPFIHDSRKNIQWRSLTDDEFNRSMKDSQCIANCFDDATRYVLLASDKGRSILKNRFKIQRNAIIDPAYKFQFSLDNNTKEVYKATQNDYYGNYFKLYVDYSDAPDGLSSFDYENSKLGLGVSIAISKLVQKHPKLKSLFSRLFMFPFIENRNCEYNKPSLAFKWFTGINPINIGEDNYHLNLKLQKDDVVNLLNELADLDTNCYSFVGVTGNKKVKTISSWHTVPILNVDKNKQFVTVKNKRDNSITEISFNDFVNKFKAIIGIKWN